MTTSEAVENHIQKTISSFKSVSGLDDCKPLFYAFAPGRINIIGEHVDYMGGTVVPAAVQQGCVAVIGAPPSATSPGTSIVIPGTLGFDTTAQAAAPFHLSMIDELYTQVKEEVAAAAGDNSKLDTFLASQTEGYIANLKKSNPPNLVEFQWHIYPFAVMLEALVELVTSAVEVTFAHNDQLQVVIDSNIPMASNMSSSGALCIALGFISDYFFNNKAALKSRTPLQRAERARRIETVYRKINVGLMDTVIIASAKADTVLSFKCDPDYHSARHVSTSALFEGCNASLLLVNSMVRHTLGNEYNEIRADMEKVEKHMKSHLGAKWTLVECGEQTSMEETGHRNFITANCKDNADISPQTLARGIYVAEETSRTFEFLQLLIELENLLKESSTVPMQERVHIAKKIGTLLNGTHVGLRDDLKVSTPQLDLIHATATELPSCYGGKLMGAGFGGCVLLLVTKGSEKEVIDAVQKEFGAKFNGLQCEIIPVQIGGGAFAEAVYGAKR